MFITYLCTNFPGITEFEGLSMGRVKKWIRQRLKPLENFIWLKCCVPLLDRFDKGPQVSKRSDEVDWRKTIGTEEQFRAYRLRKKLVLKWMGLSAIGMCCLIIFLTWLQWYIPTKNRAFWSAGREPERNEFSKSNVSNLFFFLLQMLIPHRFWLWSGFSFLAW